MFYSLTLKDIYPWVYWKFNCSI